MTPDPSAGDMEYIKAMLEYARDDARQVYLRVSAALAVAVLVLTQLPFEQLRGLETWAKDVFFGGLGALVLAAVLDHAYLQQIHHTRRDLAKCLITGDSKTAQTLGPKQWNRYLPLLYVGDGLLAVGAICVAVVVVALFA